MLFIRQCFRTFLLFCLLLQIPAHAQQFLPPDQAFAFKAQMQGSQSVQVTFNIAPNYYMYRDAFAFKVVSIDGDVVQNGQVKLPAAEMKFDENFNKEVAIYHNKVTVNVPIKRIADGDGLFKLIVDSRGCADKGLCYPPRKTQAVLTANGPIVSSVAAKNTEDTIKKNIKNRADSTKSSDSVTNIASASSIDEKTAKNTLPAAPNNQSNPNDDSLTTASIETDVPSNTSQVGSDQLRKPSLEAAQANATSFDNSAYARNLFDQHNVISALAIIFGLGLLLSLTPCMLPMVPILSAMLAGQKDVSRGRGFLLALAYVTGMALIYALIGVIAAKTGAGLHQYLQNPWVLGLFALILIILALSLFDVFQLQLPTRWQSWLIAKSQGKSGYTGAAIFGAVSALIASPCVTAPLVGVITYISQSGNAVLGGVALFVLAYGMGLPLLLLGAGLGRFLPKSGSWMVRIKQLIGILMVIAALWIAQPLWGKYWQKAWGEPVASSVFVPVQNSMELDTIIAQSDKPILLDLYADWCRSCIEMEHKTFSDSKVKEAMSNMTLVRVDMTTYTDAHASLLQRFDLYGPPATIVLEPLSGRERLRVIGFEDADTFVQRLSP